MRTVFDRSARCGQTRRVVVWALCVVSQCVAAACVRAGCRGRGLVGNALTGSPSLVGRALATREQRRSDAGVTDAALGFLTTHWALETACARHMQGADG